MSAPTKFWHYCTDELVSMLHSEQISNDDMKEFALDLTRRLRQ